MGSWQRTRDEIEAQLRLYEARSGVFAGLVDESTRRSLVGQLVDSVRRVEYVKRLATLNLSETRLEPANELFDPLRAAIVLKRKGLLDDACWMVFLAIHTGKHRRAEWRLARDLYAGGGPESRWTWNRISADPNAFESWVAAQRKAWEGDGVQRPFGNHRKYESLKTTGGVVKSYVRWIDPPKTHAELIAEYAKSATTPETLFHALYLSMAAVKRFGRMARFDYLTMLGKLGLAEIRPGTAYLRDSSGPLLGARLLLTGNPNGSISVESLEETLSALGTHLNVDQQVMEDAVCNWQKSPHVFKPFRG